MSKLKAVFSLTSIGLEVFSQTQVLAPLVIRKIVVLRDICGGFTFQTQTLGQPIILSITLGKDNQHSIYKLLT